MLDLGAGDGRVLIRAIQRGASRAEGWELHEAAYQVGRAHLEKAFAADPAAATKCRLLWGDARASQPQNFDIVTLFLLPRGLVILEPWLKTQLLGSSTRVVTQGWPLPSSESEVSVALPHGSCCFVNRF